LPHDGAGADQEDVQDDDRARQRSFVNAGAAFDWKRRMGRHEAYHQSAGNRAVHWICIPIELAALVWLFSAVPLPIDGLDLAVVLIALLAPVYVLTEPLAGTLMVAYLAGCRLLAEAIPLHGAGRAGLGALLFVASFAVQVGIGHRVFERGRDDTALNLAEFGATRNPAPLLLVPYYHLVEVLLAAGYRPRLRQEIAEATREELVRLDAS
jgi:uncharacterized membrane protein YGL010W